MDIRFCSVDSLIIYFGDSISKQISKDVKKAYNHLLKLQNPLFIELIPSYSSLFIKYDFLKFSFNEIKKYLKNELENTNHNDNKEEKLVYIDVYYSKEVGFDLEEVSKKSKLSIDDVIEIHSSKIYDVFAIGFLPGFAYLGEVDKSIAISRLTTPRVKIPKGSVAIADTQTAVYPVNSPGGWNIIGRTNFKLFDKSLKSLSPISIDSKIKFSPITKKEFLAQGGKIEF